MVERSVRSVLKNIYISGYREFVIIPYGTVGLQVEDILCRVFGIRPLLIVDNEVCKFNENVISVDEFKTRNIGDAAVLIATEDPGLYYEMYDSIRNYISQDRVFSLCKPVFDNLKDGNQILGEKPKISNSKIVFNGKNNILFCEPGVVLENSSLTFNGDNSLIYLGKCRVSYNLTIKIHNDSVFSIGPNSSTAGKLKAYLSEQRHCFIGTDCMFAYDICIRNSDPHLIYDCETKSRINPTKSVLIGDHVWVGQDSLILKGSRIDSGSIVGGKSVVTSKHIHANSAWAGNPARKVKENVFWDRACVHAWDQDITDHSWDYNDYISYCGFDMDPESFIYQYSSEEEISFEDIDRELSIRDSAQSKLEYLQKLYSNKVKNRFVHK